MNTTSNQIPDATFTNTRWNLGKLSGIEMLALIKDAFIHFRKYLKDIFGDNINIILATAAMNFKQLMTLWRTKVILRWLLRCKYIFKLFWEFYGLKLKLTF